MPFLYMHTDTVSAALDPSINLDGTWVLSLSPGNYLVALRHANWGVGRQLITQGMAANYPSALFHLFPSVASGALISAVTFGVLASYLSLGLGTLSLTTAQALTNLFNKTGDPVWCPENSS